jgi:hypothetical protein
MRGSGAADGTCARPAARGKTSQDRGACADAQAPALASRDALHELPDDEPAAEAEIDYPLPWDTAPGASRSGGTLRFRRTTALWFAPREYPISRGAAAEEEITQRNVVSGHFFHPSAAGRAE